MSLDRASIGVSKRMRLALALLLTPFSYLLTTSAVAFTVVSRSKPGLTPHAFKDLETSEDPRALLAEATHLYWLSNGPKAAPLFARAEKLFAAEGDSRNELYAKVGRLRSQAETMSFVDLSRILNEQLQNPIVQNDSRLRLWCLIAKGYTDIEIDYRVSKRDWLEAQDIAKSLGESQWVTRASGELGLIAFLGRKPRTSGQTSWRRPPVDHDEWRHCRPGTLSRIARKRLRRSQSPRGGAEILRESYQASGG